MKRFIYPLILAAFFILLSNAVVDAQLRDGIKAFKKRELDRAVTHLEAALKENPNDDIALIFLGMSHLIKGNHNEAEKIFNKIISMKLSPYLIIDLETGDTAALDNENTLWAYDGLGWIYLARGELDKAEESFKEVQQRVPWLSPDPYNGLGWVNWKRKDYPAAIYYFDRAIGRLFSEEANDPIFRIEALKGRGYTYFAMGEYEKAIENLKEVIEKGDKNSVKGDIYSLLGWSYIKNWQHKEAVPIFEKLVRMEEGKGSHEVYNGLGLSYLYTKQYGKARDAFKKSIALSRNNPLAFLGMIELDAIDAMSDSILSTK